MPNDEEIDFDQAKPLKLAAEVSPEKIVDFFKGEESNPMQPKEITEEILKRLYENLEEAAQLAKLIEMDKKDLKELAAGLESVQKGGYVAFFKEVKGRKSVKWEKLAKDMIGKLSEDDLKKYTEEGEPSIRLEVRKVH
jgi:hypothetical protein